MLKEFERGKLEFISTVSFEVIPLYYLHVAYCSQRFGTQFSIRRSAQRNMFGHSHINTVCK